MNKKTTFLIFHFHQFISINLVNVSWPVSPIKSSFNVFSFSFFCFIRVEHFSCFSNIFYRNNDVVYNRYILCLQPTLCKELPNSFTMILCSWSLVRFLRVKPSNSHILLQYAGCKSPIMMVWYNWANFFIL